MVQDRSIANSSEDNQEPKKKVILIATFEDLPFNMSKEYR